MLRLNSTINIIGDTFFAVMGWICAFLLDQLRLEQPTAESSHVCDADGLHWTTPDQLPELTEEEMEAELQSCLAVLNGLFVPLVFPTNK